MLNGQFELPIWFDLLATFSFALTGALAAMRRRYDIVGIFFLALISGIGGGLIRDGIFIQQGHPALLTDPRYIEVVTIATGIAILLRNRIHSFGRLIEVVDALGLGTYAVFGTQKSLAAGLSIPASILVGVINAVGGGILRDVLTREEPLVFKPGQFYGLIAFAAACLFVTVGALSFVTATNAAFIVIGATFIVRNLTIWLDWRTSPF